MTSVLLVLLFAVLAAVYLFSRNIDRRNRAWHLLTLLTGRRPTRPGDELVNRRGPSDHRAVRRRRR